MGYPLPSTQSQALLKESKSQRMPEKPNETEVLLKALAVSPSDSGGFCLCHTPHLPAPAELARLDLLLASASPAAAPAATPSPPVSPLATGPPITEVPHLNLHPRLL